MSEWRYAIRAVLRSPGFATLAGLSLAIGIGANVAIYSVIDAVLLRPLLRVGSPQALVSVVSDVTSYPGYRDIRDHTRALAGTAAFSPREVAILTPQGPRLGTAMVVSGNFFAVLQSPASAGRTLQPSDDEPGADHMVAVVSQRFAQRRFGQSGSAIDEHLSVNGTSIRIVGVAPAGFRGPTLHDSPDLWVPIHAWPGLAAGTRRPDIERRGWGWLNVVGRLRDDASLQQAEAELNVIAAQAPDHSAGDARVRLAPTTVAAAGDRSHSELTRFLALLSAIVGAALLMACANVANLMMVRVLGRGRELAVRQAIGASRRRIARLLLAESLTLSIAAGAVGLLAALWVIDLFRGFALPGGIPLEMLDLRLDAQVLAVALALSVATGLIFGLFPAWRSARIELLPGLNDGSLKAGSRSGGRQTLVGVQVAVCLALVASASLFIQSVRTTLGSRVGFDVSQIAVAGIAPGLQRYDADRTRRVFDSVRASLLADPHVEAASWAVTLPLTGERMRESVDIDGVPRLRDGERFMRFNAVGAGYFHAMAIPLREGRDFADQDRPGSPLVAVVNETMARRYWSGRSPLGSRISLLNADFVVVGVVADSAYETLGLEPVPHVYAALAQSPDATVASVIVRTTGNASTLVPLIRETIARHAPDLPLTHASTFRERFAAQLMPQRFAATLLTLFGAAALALAGVGVYGVTSFAVATRRREIGIRMAVGAARRDIARLVIGGTIAPLVGGTAAGLAGTALLTHAASGMLPGVSAVDPAGLIATAGGLVILAIAASALPVRRALAIEPADALRSNQ